MKRTLKYATAGIVVGLMGLGKAFGGEANTTATATNGYGRPGAAAATANYDGVGGQAFARTRTNTEGPVAIGRGLAVGFDRDGLDVSFSHALAPILGPAYAGTFNLSIGRDGQVTTSHGGTLAAGGLVRTVEAGGMSRSDVRGTSGQAYATGHTAPGGRVDSWTRSNTTPAVRPVSMVRSNIRGWHR